MGGLKFKYYAYLYQTLETKSVTTCHWQVCSELIDIIEEFIVIHTKIRWTLT